MSKEEIIKELEKLNKDANEYSNYALMNEGYRTAIMDAIDLVKKLTIPVVVECKHDFEPYYNWCSELAGYRCEKCGEEKD